MLDRLYVLIRNWLVFWVFIDLMPGIEAINMPASLIVAGFLYGLIRAFLPDILDFFKFPDNFWAKLMIGVLLTLSLFLALNTVFTGVLSFGEGQIGGIDFFIFTLPVFIKLNSALLVILFGAVIVNLCSIILAKLARTDT